MGYPWVFPDGLFGLFLGFSGWFGLGDSGWVSIWVSMDFQIGFSWNILDYLGLSWTVF